MEYAATAKILESEESWVWTSPRSSGVVPVENAMDDRRDLIEQLCTLAGMIFEDASAAAISIGPAPGLQQKIERIRSAAQDAEKLAEAALVVLRHQE
jgi:hypothetical protein